MHYQGERVRGEKNFQDSIEVANEMFDNALFRRTCAKIFAWLQSVLIGCDLTMAQLSGVTLTETVLGSVKKVRLL